MLSQTQAIPLSAPGKVEAGSRSSQGRLRWSHGILFRAVAGLVAIIVFVTAVMFLSIDGFVSVQFSELGKQRVTNQVSVMKSQLESERQGLAALAELISTDSDLRQSAQYHLLLEGERRPLETDVERIVSAFQFELFGVWDSVGAPVFVNEGRRIDVENELRMEGKAISRLIWHDDRLWVFATAPVVANDLVLAWIGMVRQFNTLGQESGFLRAVSEAEQHYRGPVFDSAVVDTPVFTLQGHPISLALQVSDPVREALDRTKRVVGVTLLGAAILLILASILYLRRVLDPLRELTSVVNSLPRRLEEGDLQPIRVRAGGEVAALGVAFNEMMRNLLQLRTLEAELRDQEKLTAIGRVAVRLAHDINNPLTVIKNTAHLLNAPGNRDQQTRQDLDLILHHCNRCASIVDNLLRFGKPARLRYQDIEVNGCMEALLQGLHQRRGNVSVRYVPMPEPLIMRGDRYQLEQLMDNLIDNALYANGGKEIVVETGYLEDGFVHFRITDFGKGFGADELAHAFDFFYTTTTGGTGLGLPNARAIARAHGGDVIITNPVIGELTVRLPRDGAPWVAPDNARQMCAA